MNLSSDPPSGQPPRVEADPEPRLELPDVIRDEAELDDWLTRPRPALVEFIRTVSSPLLVLGAGGKMGPTLAVLAQRAAAKAGHPLQVVAVSRFSDPSPRRWLEAHGVSTLSADLLERPAVQGLPDSAHVIYLVGLKFGTRQNPALTWAVNTLAPAHVAERYPAARLVALSTGNVYPLVPVCGPGATEDQALTPLGEYANAAVARERLLEYCSRRHGTRVALLRLNYAVELRYGVLADIAAKVWTGQPVDLSNGHLNCLWQADANDLILRTLSLAVSPAQAWNLTGPRALRVRDVAEHFARVLDRPVQFVGAEADTALLSNPARLCAALGEPPTPVETVLRWTAHWVRSGRRSLDRPTHFEVRNGHY